MRNDSVTNKEEEKRGMMKKHLRIHNHQVIRGEKQSRKLWHQYMENKLPKGSTKTQQVTNAPHFISPSEPPAPK